MGFRRRAILSYKILPILWIISFILKLKIKKFATFFEKVFPRALQISQIQDNILVIFEIGILYIPSGWIWIIVDAIPSSLLTWHSYCPTSISTVITVTLLWYDSWIIASSPSRDKSITFIICAIGSAVNAHSSAAPNCSFSEVISGGPRTARSTYPTAAPRSDWAMQVYRPASDWLTRSKTKTGLSDKTGESPRVQVTAGAGFPLKSQKSSTRSPLAFATTRWFVGLVRTGESKIYLLI